MTPAGWLDEARTDLASERILDAAESLFHERGVARVTVEDVARAAGCSRATVYRYFEDRTALRVAFVHRHTRRLSAEVAEAVAGIDDQDERMVEAVIQSVEAVRSRPALLAWFRSGNAELTADLVLGSPVIHAAAAGLIDTVDCVERGYQAEWLVRIVVSFLMFPASTPEQERTLVERFVVPVLSSPA